MKILVTGATGFIGNYVVAELLKYKIDVIATYNDIRSAKKSSWYKKVRFVNFNINYRRKNYFDLFDKPDKVIHLAWEGLPNYKELYHFEKNLFNHYYFIKNMVENGLSDFTGIGTCFEYGLSEGCLSEDMCTNPITPYGIAKDTLRKFVSELNKKYEFKFRWIRLFYLYGKGQKLNSLLSQLEFALDSDSEVFNMSGGEQERDFLPVESVAEYIVKITLQEKILGNINCCSGFPISVKSLVDKKMKEKNKFIKLNLGYYPYLDYEPMCFWGSTEKLKKILEDLTFPPKTSPIWKL